MQQDSRQGLNRLGALARVQEKNSLHPWASRRPACRKVMKAWAARDNNEYLLTFRKIIKNVRNTQRYHPGRSI